MRSMAVMAAMCVCGFAQASGPINPGAPSPFIVYTMGEITSALSNLDALIILTDQEIAAQEVIIEERWNTYDAAERALAIFLLTDYIPGDPDSEGTRTVLTQAHDVAQAAWAAALFQKSLMLIDRAYFVGLKLLWEALLGDLPPGGGENPPPPPIVP